MTRTHSMKSVAHSETDPTMVNSGPSTPSISDAIAPLVMYTIYFKQNAQAGATIQVTILSQSDFYSTNENTPQSSNTREVGEAVTRSHAGLQLIPAECTQSRYIRPPWLSTTVHARMFDWRSHRPSLPPPPGVTNVSPPQHPEPPVSEHAAIVTGNRSPSPVSSDTNKRGQPILSPSRI